MSHERTPDARALDQDSATPETQPYDTQPHETPTPESASSEETVAAAAEPERPRRRRGLLVGAAVVGLLAVGGTGAAVAAAHKTVTLEVDGESVQVSTFSGDVEGVLTAEGVEVGEHDLLVPGPDEALTDGTEIVIRTAEQITVQLDGITTDVWTVGDTAGQALADLEDSGRAAEITASRTSGRPALELPVVENGPVVVRADGETRTIEIDGVGDLTAVLLAAEVSVDDDDLVTVTTAKSGAPLVTVARVEVGPSTRTESVPFDTVERETDDLYEGEERVVAEGAEGTITYTSSDRSVDGEVTSSQLVSVEVTPPTDRVVEVGTAQRPAPAPAPAPAESSDDGGSGGSGGGAVSGDVWAALAQCESGGNPTTNTGNGYYGLYQFSLPTWQAMGGSGLPSEASAAEQTQRAQALQAQSGWGQWPACSAKLGLR